MHYTPIKPAGEAVKRVLLWYDSSDGMFLGLELFNKDSVKILETKKKLTG